MGVEPLTPQVVYIVLSDEGTTTTNMSRLGKLVCGISASELQVNYAWRVRGFFVLHFLYSFFLRFGGWRIRFKPGSVFCA